MPTDSREVFKQWVTTRYRELCKEFGAQETAKALRDVGYSLEQTLQILGIKPTHGSETRKVP